MWRPLFMMLITLHQLALALVVMYYKNTTKKGIALLNQKRQSIEIIRLNSSSIFNELENLSHIYDKEHNERMYKKTMELITSLNKYIIDIYAQTLEEGK